MPPIFDWWFLTKKNIFHGGLARGEQNNLELTITIDDSAYETAFRDMIYPTILKIKGFLGKIGHGTCLVRIFTKRSKTKKELFNF